VKHAGGVVLHFSLFEIKVFRLVVGDPDLYPVVVHVSPGRSSPGRRSSVPHRNKQHVTFIENDFERNGNTTR